MNNIPVIIQQYAENALDTNTPDHIRFNYLILLENIRKYCDRAIDDYNKNNKVKRP